MISTFHRTINSTDSTAGTLGVTWNMALSKDVLYQQCTIPILPETQVRGFAVGFVVTLLPNSQFHHLN